MPASSGPPVKGVCSNCPEGSGAKKTLKCICCGKNYCHSHCSNKGYIPSKNITSPGMACDDCEATHKVIIFEESKKCSLCDKKFSTLIRGHHCRCCGLAVCASCGGEKHAIESMGYVSPVRVCKVCFKHYVKKPASRGSRGPFSSRSTSDTIDAASSPQSPRSSQPSMGLEEVHKMYLDKLKEQELKEQAKVEAFEREIQAAKMSFKEKDEAKSKLEKKIQDLEQKLTEAGKKTADLEVKTRQDCKKQLVQRDTEHKERLAAALETARSVAEHEAGLKVAAAEGEVTKLQKALAAEKKKVAELENKNKRLRKQRAGL